MSGLKFDTGKPDLSLMPLAARVAVARALEVGVRKYGRNNYTKGFKASRLIAAAERHLTAWFHKGEEDDPEDGQPHLGAAIACIAILIDIQQRGTLDDDREQIQPATGVQTSPKAEAGPTS